MTRLYTRLACVAVVVCGLIVADDVALDVTQDSGVDTDSNGVNETPNYQLTDCLAQVDTFKKDIEQISAKLKTAEELAQAAQKSMELEAKENVKAQSALGEYKRLHVEALAEEVKLREAAEKSLAVHKATAIEIAKELAAHKQAVDGLKDELSKEIEKSLELKRAEGATASELMDKVVAYDLLNEKYTKLQEVYNEALDHLAHPMLSEYLTAQGKELGEMRPELKAALEKAKEVISIPDNVLEKLDRGKQAIMKGHENLRSGVAPYVGDKHANSVSLGLVMLFMIPPVYLVYRFIHSIQRTLQAQHFVLALNFLAMSYFSVVATSSMMYQVDVLQNLQKTQPASYAILQFVTLGFFATQIWWSGIFCLVLVDNRIKYAQISHLLASIGVIVHYYEHVWSRAMLDQEHEVQDAVFFVYAVVYATGLVPALISNSKNLNSVHATSAAYTTTDSLKRS